MKEFDKINYLATQICPFGLQNVKNELKPYICSYSSLFTYIFLRKNANKYNIENYASDYCSHLNEVEVEKLQYINVLASNYNKRDIFDFDIDICSDVLMNYNHNSWIDPVIPNESLVIGTMCKNILTLMNSINKHQHQQDLIIPFELFIEKVNSLILMHYLNMIQLEVYNDCTDDIYRQIGFKKFCEKSILKHIDFWIWNDQEKLQICNKINKDQEFKDCAEASSNFFKYVSINIQKKRDQLYTNVQEGLSRILMNRFEY